MTIFYNEVLITRSFDNGNFNRFYKSKWCINNFKNSSYSCGNGQPPMLPHDMFPFALPLGERRSDIFKEVIKIDIFDKIIFYTSVQVLGEMGEQGVGVGGEGGLAFDYLWWCELFGLGVAIVAFVWQWINWKSAHFQKSIM